MYLASLHVTLDLEPEVASSDRERVLRSLRDRLKSHYGARVTVRTDDDSAVVVAFLDDNLERAKTRLDEITENLDDAGQARILSSVRQVFAWFEGVFQETAESRHENAGNRADSQGGSPFAGTFSAAQMPLAPPSRGPGFLGKPRPPQTIVYADEDEEFEAPPQGRGLGRRGLRIPTRK